MPKETITRFSPFPTSGGKSDPARLSAESTREPRFCTPRHPFPPEPDRGELHDRSICFRVVRFLGIHWLADIIAGLALAPISVRLARDANDRLNARSESFYAAADC